MVKFFLRNQKSLPKRDLVQNKNDKQRVKHHHTVKDFRFVIYENLFRLIKSEHQSMVQKLIRKIKQIKAKLQEPITNGKTDKQRKSFNKDLQKLQTKYSKLKTIRKEQIKKIVLYIIKEVIIIQNIDKLIQRLNKKDKKLTEKKNKKKQGEKGEVENSKVSDQKQEQSKQENQQNAEQQKKDKIETAEFKQFVQNNQIIKNFVQKITMLTAYQQELQKCASLLDVVQQKKNLRKEKIKQRKTRKYERQHQLKDSSGKPIQKQGEQLDQSEEKKSDQEENEPIQKQQFNQHLKNNKRPFESSSNYQKNKSFNKESKFFNNRQGERPSGRSYEKQKFIKKERTQFKKTGRNKLKYEKQKKKQQYRNRGRESSNNGKYYQTQKRGTSSQQGGYKDKKYINPSHPSWQAKQQMKNQQYIRPFQGKKILL